MKKIIATTNAPAAIGPYSPVMASFCPRNNTRPRSV